MVQLALIAGSRLAGSRVRIRIRFGHSSQPINESRSRELATISFNLPIGYADL